MKNEYATNIKVVEVRPQHAWLNTICCDSQNRAAMQYCGVRHLGNAT